VRLVIDCDPGNGIPGADVDDGLALALALRSPEVELEAVTVVAGNVPVERGVACALEILQVADAPFVPVHRGADRPLVADPRQWREQLDARRDDPLAQTLWRDVRSFARRGRPEAATPAAQALVEHVRARPGEVTVLAVGPLTNVATAMLLDPEWANDVARIVMMGGAFDAPNVLQELNTSYDPEATHIVLSSAAPVTMVPLDVTLQTFLRLDDVDTLDRAGTALAGYLAQTTRPWVSWLAARFGRDGCPLHDPLAMVAILDPAAVTTRTACVGIELSGTLTRGRTVSWAPADSHSLHAGLRLPDVRPVTIADGVDNARFLPLLLDRVCR
jgi:inosine-uridine nucleoside N-ribohydrolase